MMKMVVVRENEYSVDGPTLPPNCFNDPSFPVSQHHCKLPLPDGAVHPWHRDAEEDPMRGWVWRTRVVVKNKLDGEHWIMF